MITPAQSRAARALIEWTRDVLARASGVDVAILKQFEDGSHALDQATGLRVRNALEGGGAHFIEEDAEGGAGVRLKFTARDVRAIRRWEGEGGPVGEDDV
jgi:hypothetical protein